MEKYNSEFQCRCSPCELCSTYQQRHHGKFRPALKTRVVVFRESWIFKVRKDLTLVVKRPMMGDALLDLLHANEEEWVMYVKGGGSLGFSDHEMVDFRILRKQNKAKSSITTLDIKKADLGIFRDTFGRSPQAMTLDSRGVQKSCLIFKDHLLQTQEWPIPTSQEASKTSRRPV